MVDLVFDPMHIVNFVCFLFNSMSLNSGRAAQYTHNVEFLRHFGLHGDVNDAHRAGANRLKNKTNKNLELGRVPCEDKEADLGANYLERDPIKKCVTKIGMLFAGAWAGEQLPVVSGSEVLIGLRGQGWTMGVVLLITVGVVLLGFVFAVFVSHLPTGNVHVTREAAIAKQRRCMSPRAMQDDDLDRGRGAGGHGDV